ncbi:MAG TPA: hypothetical protein VFB35_10270 [Gaiellaceae bacterium]|nr:hypothetical protein [Gaiellaceae bacterium]
MPGFAPRFALEAGFLILLGAGAGYADLRTKVIVAILAGGWLLVTLVELAIWRSSARPAAEPVWDPPPPLPPDGELAAADGDGTGEPADAEYPLRSGAGEERSDEVEAYTRIIEGAAGDEPRDA